MLRTKRVTFLMDFLAIFLPRTGPRATHKNNMATIIAYRQERESALPLANCACLVYRPNDSIRAAAAATSIVVVVLCSIKKWKKTKTNLSAWLCVCSIGIRPCCWFYQESFFSPDMPVIDLFHAILYLRVNLFPNSFIKLFKLQFLRRWTFDTLLNIMLFHYGIKKTHSTILPIIS